MEQGKHYYAFISHSTKDEKIALWLCNKLDNYHIPTTVQKEYGAPKNLKPNFTFQTNLAGNKLRKALGNELDDSQYLIVVCSPDAAHSSYVNDEVQHFIDTGKTDKIIPFIIEGTPDDCFPPALLSLKGEDELRGVNLKETEKHLGSKMAAVVNVIATMLGVRFDVLLDKYRRRRTRRDVILCAIALLLASFGLFLWDYNRPTYRYFVDYVDCWGVPEGIIKLSKEQVSHRGASYQFEYHRIPFGEPNAYSWRLDKVSYVNSSLFPIEVRKEGFEDRFPIIELDYDKSTGEVIKHTCCDTKGSAIVQCELSDKAGTPVAIVDFHNIRGRFGSAFVNGGITGGKHTRMDLTKIDDYMYEKPNIVRHVYERDTLGHIICRTNHNSNHYNLQSSITSDSDGIFGCHYLLDSLGRRVKIEYCGKNGENVCNKRGVAGLTLSYDNGGNPTKITYYDLNGKPILNDELWAFVSILYDEHGNEIDVSYFDSKGEPCFDKRNGISRLIMKYDQRGYQIEEKYLDPKGNPCFSSGGFAKCIVKSDRKGNMTEIAFFDTNNLPCVSKFGSAKWMYKYDKKGNQTEGTNYDIMGNPCLDNDLIYKQVNEYDNYGNRIKESYYGLDDKPCFMSYSHAGTIVKYDDLGKNIIEISYFGMDEKPIMANVGYAKIMIKYDKLGNIKEENYFSADGKPMMIGDGYAKLKANCDDNGNRIEETYFDINGNNCLSKLGCAKTLMKYENGKLIEESYYGVTNDPIVNSYGFAKAIFQYDSIGNRIEEAYYGIDDSLCLSKGGFAKCTIKYDYLGNMIGLSYYDDKGELCIASDGYASWISLYDERKNKTELSYYDIKGELCLSNDGYAKQIAMFDERGNMVEMSYFDTKGNLCLSNDGYARCVVSYDERGNKVNITYYDEKNEVFFFDNQFLFSSRWQSIDSGRYVQIGEEQQFMKY